jgi:hypothetical protein
VGFGYGSKEKSHRHAQNIKDLMDSLAATLNGAARAMSLAKVERAQEHAARLHKALADYMIFFSIRRKMPAMPSFAAALARAERLENPDPASLDKRERAAAQRAQAKYATARLREIDRELAPRDYSLMAARSDWRLGEPWEGAGGMWRLGKPVMLRIEDGEIETSMGARIPLAAAPMVWNLVQRAIDGANGFEPTRALGRLKIGDYPLDRIDGDGTLHAGCHAIPYSELELMARRLGL